MTGSNLHIAWARLFFRALASSGVEHVVISPGSRSTPLTLAAADDAGLQCHVIVDERSAGFFALGQARMSGRPSVLVCTSGTAGAHYLPAIIEANQSFVPLIAVTADRPWEAYDAAAPQTVDQVKFFGSHVRFYAELGLPDPDPMALRAVVRIAAQAVHRASWPSPGAVHINARFRKPLEPVDPEGIETWESDFSALMAMGAPRVSVPGATTDEQTLDEIASACVRARRGLIVAGPALVRNAPERAREAVLSLARATGFVVLPEATSQLRFGAKPDDVTVCSGFDALLRSPVFRKRHRADVILELGAPPTSMGYAAYLAELRGCARYVIAQHGFGDPFGDAVGHVRGDPYEVAYRLAERVNRVQTARPTAWAKAFAEGDRRAWAAVDREIWGSALTEGVIARRLVDALPQGAVLVVGNSGPVRDLDTYCPAGAHALCVLHQRGASGIDGLVSGAAGVRSVRDSAPVALFLGDLSLLHDLGGLNIARSVRKPLLMVVVQNNGGRIFEQLSIAKCPEVAESFEPLFVTPQGIEFQSAAAMFGISYHRVETPEAFSSTVVSALARDRCTLIEAVVPAHDGSARRAALWSQIAQTVQADPELMP